MSTQICDRGHWFTEGEIYLLSTAVNETEHEEANKGNILHRIYSWHTASYRSSSTCSFAPWGPWFLSSWSVLIPIRDRMSFRNSFLPLLLQFLFLFLRLLTFSLFQRLRGLNLFLPNMFIEFASFTSSHIGVHLDRKRSDWLDSSFEASQERVLSSVRGLEVRNRIGCMKLAFPWRLLIVFSNVDTSLMDFDSHVWAKIESNRTSWVFSQRLLKIVWND